MCINIIISKNYSLFEVTIRFSIEKVDFSAVWSCVYLLIDLGKHNRKFVELCSVLTCTMLC